MSKKKILIFIFIFQLIFMDSFARDYIVIQSTTSTNNSGLLYVIEKAFEEKYNIDLRFVSVGTGQAIKNCKKGDCDLLLVHSQEDEIDFIEEGYGLERFEIMYNDFVILGPKHDPAGLSNSHDIIDAMQKLKINKNYFISRNDNSGTNKRELFLWKMANIELGKKDTWYLKNGLGMGATINMASEIDAYTLSDRGTWLFFNNKKYLKVLFEGDKFLYNPYGAIPANPERFPSTEYTKSMVFINWLIGEEGKSIISEYRLNGKQLFFTN